MEGASLAATSLTQLIRVFPEMERVASSLMTGTPSLSALPQALVSAFGRYGFLENDSPGPMVGAGLKVWWSGESGASVAQKLPFELEAGAAQVSVLSASEAGSDLWADLLSEVNRSRNILENQMREFASSVLKIEASGRADGQKPIDLIGKAIPANRRDDILRLGVSAAMKKLLWLDLVNICTKYWPSFEKHLGDKSKFVLHCEIVNDRPDAHAKDIDAADLALQRRSISYLQEKIVASGMV